MPTLRQRQINRLLRDYVAAALIHLVELPPGVVVSITKVHTTADLQHAQIYLSALPDTLAGSTLQLIQQHAPEIIAAVAERITFHTVPKFKFRLDDTERKAARIEALLDKLKQPD